MKKIYTKPAVYFDSFELSQSIAIGCSFDVDDSVHRYDTIFNSSYECEYDYSTSPECYHVSENNLKPFNS